MLSSGTIITVHSNRLQSLHQPPGRWSDRRFLEPPDRNGKGGALFRPSCKLPNIHLWRTRPLGVSLSILQSKLEIAHEYALCITKKKGAELVKLRCTPLLFRKIKAPSELEAVLSEFMSDT